MLLLLAANTAPPPRDPRRSSSFERAARRKPSAARVDGRDEPRRRRQPTTIAARSLLRGKGPRGSAGATFATGSGADDEQTTTPTTPTTTPTTPTTTPTTPTTAQAKGATTTPTTPTTTPTTPTSAQAKGAKAHEPRASHRQQQERGESPEEKLTPEARSLLATIESHRATGHPALLVAQTAPAVRVALSEEFGREPGAFSPGQMVAALRALGLAKVVDTNTAADLCICEEGTELLQRLVEAEEKEEEKEKEEKVKGGGKEKEEEGKPRARTAEEEGEPRQQQQHHHHHSPGILPMFTSCCPGWIQLVEKTMPELWPYVSSCKSPHMMLGALLKRVTRDVWGGHEPEDVYLCSVMPCVRKKGESTRPEFVAASGVRDVDEVITTRDLGALLRRADVNPGDLEESDFDSPLGLGSGAGQLFGVTGGVMARG